MYTVASFHSGDPDQVVPVVLYTVVLFTLILHRAFAYFANVRVLLLRLFRQREEFS
jgi:hypothetical protein